MKKQHKMLVASLVAVPVAIAATGAAEAAEVTETTLPTFEVHNDFVHTTSASSVESTKELTAKSLTELHAQITNEMRSYNKGFTITYTVGDADNYKMSVEQLFAVMKDQLNKDDYTMLYGTFNNMRVEATELKTAAGQKDGVKLRFSVSYFSDPTATAALVKLAEELTTPTNPNAILTADMTKEQKLFAIHNYVVNNSYVLATNHNLSALVLNGYGSSHAYALLTYNLLKKAGFDVRYVTGLVDGELYSWNVVELNGKHYHFDTAGDDNETSGSTDVNYRYFLAGNEGMGNRVIQYGATIADNQWGNAYEVFKNMANPSVVGTKLYYADAAFGGELKVYDFATGEAKNATNLAITQASAPHNGVFYYKHTSSDTVTVLGEDLYFINNSVGNYLYKYSLLTNELTLLVNAPILSMEVRRSTLVYHPANSEQKTIRLDAVENHNEEAAKKVIEAIAKLDVVTGDALKRTAVEARQLYNGLTPDQRLLVGNLQVLLDKELILSGNDVAIKTLVTSINTLDPLAGNYIAKVKEAMEDYTLLPPAKQGQIYNSSILQLAYQQVLIAEALKTKIAVFVGTGDKSPFAEKENSLLELEEIKAEYDALLPSLKLAIPSQHVIYLNSYRAEAEALRAAVQTLINEINIIDENASNYLRNMERIQTRYTAFFASQKLIISEVHRTKIETHIAQVTEMLAEIAAFEAAISDMMGTFTAVTVPLTVELVEKAQAAKVQLDAMKVSQFDNVSPQAKLDLDNLLLRIAGIVNDPAVKAVTAQITALDHTVVALTAENFVAQIASADAAYIALSDAYKIGISSATLAKLTTYKEKTATLIAQVETMQQAINALTDASTKAEVQAVRASFTALSDVAQHFIDLTNLSTQEIRLQLMDDQQAANTVIEAINKLTIESALLDVLKVEEMYIQLNATAKNLVSNYATLIALKNAKQQELNELNRQARAVMDLIDALSEKSTVAQVVGARAAYDKLDDYVKTLVTNYDKLVEIEELFDELISDQQNEGLALELDNEVLSITEQTTLERVLEIYKKYEEASTIVKTLMREKELLEYWYAKKVKENEDLIEQAKKEAKLIFDRIEKISESHTEAHIRAIRVAYEALSELAKTFVTNLEKLEAAEANLEYEGSVGKELRAEAAAFDAFMAKLSRKSEEEDIREARKHYNRLSEGAKLYVTSYNKLKRLEEMFSDKDYEDLFENYYPHYMDDPKPGGVEPTESTYDPLYIPDETTQYFAYTEYEEKNSTLISGGFIKIEPKQLQHNTNKTITFTASNNVEITFSVAELKKASGTIGVTLKTDNDEVIVTFTENNRLKSFTENVIITVPFGVLGATSGMQIESKTYSGEKMKAVYKVDGTKFIISTKQSGTFTAQTAVANYTDLAGLSESRKQAIRELAQRGIISGGTAALFQPKAYILRKDIATMITTALNLTTTSTTKYTDVPNAANATAAQAVLEAGIMRGASQTAFRPNIELSREQAAIIIANVLRQQKVPVATMTNPQTTSYQDAKDMSYEGQQSIALLELSGIVSGTGKFQPNGKMTRGEFAEWLYKALKKANAL
ncbi:MAG: S-layer homology domain-containing protein [Solibacillus sp.]